MSQRRSHKVLNGLATIYSPTDNKGWRVAFHDPVTRKRRILSATSKEAALAKAREGLGIWDETQELKQLTPPTVEAAFEQWLEAKSSGWVARTVEVYRYRYQGALAHLGQTPVTSIRPGDLHDIAQGLSREQGRRLKTLVRGVFDTVQGWTGRPGSLYADAIRLPGSRSDDAPRAVEQVQVPSTQWVNGVIDCAYSTCQLHPALNHGIEEIDPITGAHHHLEPMGSVGNDTWFMEQTLLDGAPQELIDSMRRGVPAHYRRREERAAHETLEIASRFRQVALITALGASGALRIGEVLALRPRHLFGPWGQNQVRLADEAMHTILGRELLEGVELSGSEQLGGRLLPGYQGKVLVQEQVSPLSTGRMNITAPKMGKERTVYLSPLLYPAWDSSRRSLRQLLSDPAIIERHGLDGFEIFDAANREQSLWSMSEADALKLWQAGFIPVGYLLHDRLREIWRQSQGDVRLWWDALLFPTRNKARQRGEGPLFPQRWPYRTEVPFGSYQHPSNLTRRFIAPLYDYVSEVTNNYPGYRGASRQGWTHHGLRHWAISQWLSRGVPLPQASKQAGHAQKQFTLARYAWAIEDELTVRGFEP